MAQSSFREQFGDLARKKGVQESLIPYWTNWVMAWGKHLSPRKFVDAGESDVEAFLQHLADQGKAGWQIEQAEAALKLLHQSRYPAPWSADWKVRQPLAAATASPERRPPLDEEFLRARHQGKSDRGELPPRFAPFIDEIRAAVRARHYSYRTEQTYVGWITRFLAYAAPEKRQDLEPSQAKDYLDYLSVVRRVSSATQNQAFNSLLFLFRSVLEMDFGRIEGVQRAEQRRRVPVVLSRSELARLFEALPESCRLPVRLFYGAGLRLMEGLRLRIQDIDLELMQITVRRGSRTAWEAVRQTRRRRARRVDPPGADPSTAARTASPRCPFPSSRNCGSRSPKCVPLIRRIWPKATAMWSCPTASPSNTADAPVNGAGNTCSPQPGSRSTRAPDAPGAITCTRSTSSEPCAKPPARPE